MKLSTITPFKAFALICVLATASDITAQNGWTLADTDSLRAAWIGQKIVFLPVAEVLGEKQYGRWSTSPIEQIPPDPDMVVGRRAEIRDVKKNDSYDPAFVTVDLEDTTVALYGFADGNHLQDVAFTDEIILARRLLHAVLWNKRSNFYVYDSLADFRKPIIVKNLEPLYIDRISWAPSSVTPIRFRLMRVGGKRIYIDCTMTGLNPKDGDTALFFDEIFHRINPRAIYKNWKPAHWEKIEKEEVVKRMPPDAVVLAWGRPLSVRRLRNGDKIIEIWKYDRIPPATLRFEDGLLKSWSLGSK